jgi:carboxyl-terminal processing protease
MFQRKFWVLALAVLAFNASASNPETPKSPDTNNEYGGWKNQPKEHFSDGEVNFNHVRKLLLEKYYDSKLTEEQLYQLATDGMLRGLNGFDNADKEPWNKLITPTEMKELQVDMKGELIGIGVSIRFDSPTGSASVLGLVPHSVSERDGILVGDQIISVDGKLYKGLQLRDMVHDIRGKAGESIRLKILRGDKIITKDVVREQMPWTPVEFSMLDGLSDNPPGSPAGRKMGLLAIQYFNEKTSAEVSRALTRFRNEGGKSLIVDLRGNGGGLFDKELEVAGYFSPKGAVLVHIESRSGTEETVHAEKAPLIDDVPVVVLVNEETASGAELLAASLADNLHAKLIGTKTHGKWNVQSIDDLPNGYAVKYTIKTFKSPGGKSYQDVGIEPDVAISPAGENVGKSDLSSDDFKKRLSQDAVLRAAYSLLKSG